MTTKLDEFTRAYIECALWSSNDDSREDGGDPLDANYNITDIAPATLSRMAADCAAFQSEQESNLTDYPDDAAGHDFWLTRNHHGAGYWEHDYGTAEQCKALTGAAHAYGQADLYVGNDGLVYQAGAES